MTGFALTALACACQPAQDKLTGTLKLVGLFMLVPFVVAYIVIRVIRSAPPSDSITR